MSASPTPLAQALRAIAIEIAVEAGNLAKDLRGRGVRVAATKSTQTDVVTEADRATERTLIGLLADRRPDDSVLGEEGGLSVTGSSEITWVLDPIDGTVNYLYDLPIYAVSVAATVADPSCADGRRAIAGCVYIPTTGEVFAAAQGGGATLNGERIRPNRLEDLGQALVGTGFGYSRERRAEQAGIAAALLPRVRDLRRLGSAAYDLCAVAAGRLDAYYERGLQPWDYAAGFLIAAESGAAVLGHRDGSAPGEWLAVVAHRPLAEQLRVLTSQEAAPEGWD
ncbi:inositol monophosphatase family protein [Leucobacter sp. M11]|uniref:inositol monophosphatase family protein n=1 Tax=Leucobacter sp. M11 TaxID=2993565 RepID=UPI002D7FAC01|nr:inositol monophosphatase family protein [Leucobacter sp. M11]MEB4613894.1 inositol monophosphatase family protein [Leucobacter sp. M11]